MPCKITITDVLAWWGGLTGTLAFAWDLYKWRRRGPRILVDLVTDILGFASAPQAVPDERFVVLTATSVGITYDHHEHGSVLVARELSEGKARGSIAISRARWSST